MESGNYLLEQRHVPVPGRACYLDELERFRPDILAATQRAWDKRATDLDFLRLDAEAFAACPADSIDYAVMEQTDRAAVVAGRHRLERCRLVDDAVGGRREGRATAT